MSNVKKSPKQILSSLKRQVKDVDSALFDVLETTTNVNGGVDILVPEAVALKDKASIDKAHQGMELKFQGTDKKNSMSMQRTIEKTIEDKYRNISTYTASGMQKQLFLAKQNRYMAQEFPDLEKSLRLFTTDVCYGSYFSANDTTNNQFVIRKDGVVIEDENLKKTILEIVNPSSSKKEDVNYRSFDDLDFEATKISRMDGYSIIRLVETKKILTDLYIKYVLKKTKSKTVTNTTSTLRASSTESLNLINGYLEDIGFEHTIPDTTYNLALLPDHIQKAIPKTLLIDETISRGDMEDACPVNSKGDKRMPDGFEEYEEFIFAHESFSDFAFRMLSGKTSTMAVYQNSNENSDKRHVYSIGLESHSLDIETANEILHTYFMNNSEFNVDECEVGLESASRRLNIFDSNLLSKITYEELYSIDTFTIAEKIKGNIESTINHGIESILNKTTEPKPKLIMSPIEQLVKNVIIADHSPIVGIESELREIYNKAENDWISANPGLESSATFRNSLTPESGSILLKGTSSTIDNVNKKYHDSIDKTLKMFDHIKGCSSVILDNRRTIPLMMGNKNNGCLYIEKTHAEIEHLIATRSVISNPMGGTNTMSLFQLDEEQKESTIARLIFTDTIKPVFERNMNTKFLRENADLMYTVKELLEENELSRNDKSFGAFSDMGYFNLSKVSFIPANEIIMYTNGDGLGKSLFESAFVPANAYILANESYLSWILVDGKGICFVTYPQGLNDLNGAYGANPLSQLIEDTLCTRMSLKMSATDNTRLSRPVITLPVGEDGSADKIDIKDVKPPEFDIDHETISRWKEEATGIVGYPASTFTDLNNGGSRPELARKMESLDASIVLDITQAQDKKVHSSNSLATKLLHYRGGKEYQSYTLEWIPPRPSRSNNNLKKEIVTEKKEVLDAYINMFESLFEGREDWDVIKPYFNKVLNVKLFPDDKYLSESENLYKEAAQLLNVHLGKQVKEVD